MYLPYICSCTWGGEVTENCYKVKYKQWLSTILLLLLSYLYLYIPPVHNLFGVLVSLSLFIVCADILGHIPHIVKFSPPILWDQGHKCSREATEAVTLIQSLDIVVYKAADDTGFT